MKHVIVEAMVFGLLIVPAYAALETSERVMPEKTIVDFQRENPGKPIVGWYKYEQYKKMLTGAPQPTLEASRIRTETSKASSVRPVVSEKTLADLQKEYAGQKPIVAWYAFKGSKRERMRTDARREVSGTRPVTSEKTLVDFQKRYAGQKPIVAWHAFEEHKQGKRS